MKKVNIMEANQFLGEEGLKKTIYKGSCLKGTWTICRGLGKK